MNKLELTIPTNPDDYSSGHSVKRAMALLVVSIVICWVAMELLEMVAIVMPVIALVVIHAVSLVGLVLIYRWLQLRAQRRL